MLPAMSLTRSSWKVALGSAFRYYCPTIQGYDHIDIWSLDDGAIHEVEMVQTHVKCHRHLQKVAEVVIKKLQKLPI